MIRRLFWAFAFSALALTSAQAADVAEPAAYDWSGFYIGAQAGYGWGDNTFTYEDATPEEHVGLDFDGFVGGLTLGYNKQVNSVVIGVEGDISYADLHDDVVLPPTAAPCYIQGCSIDIDWFSTVRLRLGYAMDSLLPFITGGIAFGDVEGTFDEGACGCSINETAFGWTVGGGLEWAFDDNWSTKLEYLYVNLGEPDPESDFDGEVVDFVSTDDFAFSVVRLGVNYRFN